jgi:hypothetical protein
MNGNLWSLEPFNIKEMFGRHHLIAVLAVADISLHVAQLVASLIDVYRLDNTVDRVRHQQMATKEQSYPSQDLLKAPITRNLLWKTSHVLLVYLKSLEVIFIGGNFPFFIQTNVCRMHCKRFSPLFFFFFFSLTTDDKK